MTEEPDDDGRLVQRIRVNETAPRVHNSGHWTLDGALCSQFEQHIRAIAGWPLGATRHHGAAVEMRNLIGDDVNAGPISCATPAPACTSMARPRPGRAAKWVM